MNSIGDDDISSAIVVAKNENDARLIHPSYCRKMSSTWSKLACYSEWANSPKHVAVKYLGVASESLDESCVIIIR